MAASTGLSILADLTAAGVTISFELAVPARVVETIRVKLGWKRNGKDVFCFIVVVHSFVMGSLGNRCMLFKISSVVLMLFPVDAAIGKYVAIKRPSLIQCH